MKRYRVSVTPAAASDIEKAHAWYLSEDPVYAAKWLAGLEAAILQLRNLPLAHGIAPESRAFGREIRQLLYGKGRRWRVYFVVDDATVRVLHVGHASRDYWRG